MMPTSEGDPSRTRCSIMIFLALMPSLALAGFGAEPLEPAASRAVIGEWVADLEKAKDLLEAGKYKKVRDRMDAQLAEMAERFRSGAIEDELLGTGSALRAIAHAGLGDLESAAWDWGVARSLVPEIDRLDRSRFGAAGAFVESEEFRALFGNLDRSGAQEPSSVTPESELAENLEPPRKEYAPAPQYPAGKRDACLEQPLVIEVVVGRDGRPYAPRLAQPGDSVLFFITAETLRHWRFEPARLDGKPVSTFYRLTVNYRMRFCPDGPRRPGY